MKRKHLKLFTGFLILASPVLQAEWLKVFDFEDYNITTDENEIIAQGWVFQDYNFFGYPECIQKTKDCTSVREIKFDPYESSNKVISIRSADPEVVDPANTSTPSAYDLPAPIPVGGTATLYFRVAAEDENISMHFGVTAYDEPESYYGSEAGIPTHSYGNLAAAAQISPLTRSTLGIYHGFWSDATLDTEKVIETGIWYELWFHIYNEPPSVGGGYYEVYISGGAFGEEPLHLPNPYLDQAVKDLGITSWDFRDIRDAPLTRFLNVGNGLNPADNPVNDGAILFDDMYLMLGEFSTDRPIDECTDCPPECTTPTNFWADLEVVAGTEYKDTGLGWVHDAHFPWIYSEAASAWLFVACDSTLESMYVYNASDDTWYWTFHGAYGWHFKAGDTTYGDEGWAAW